MALFKSFPWDKWWWEFLTSRQKNGRLTYVSAYQFAKAKAKAASLSSASWPIETPARLLLTIGNRKVFR